MFVKEDNIRFGLQSIGRGVMNRDHHLLFGHLLPDILFPVGTQFICIHQEAVSGEAVLIQADCD